MVSRGNPVIGKRQITLLLPTETIDKVRKGAQESGLSISIYLELLISDSLPRWNRDKPTLPKYESAEGKERFQPYLSHDLIGKIRYMAVELDCSMSAMAEDAVGNLGAEN